eukprot:CAMPEP_0181534448 /NCGR_PEP_ID=MMETSP1110-20121109/73749_1 /TAXON_ID=174948 /ORGANISM="Symbiodinium sp., Strain CCMP421" /LENGTH=459 /DNA_ID=CAMNT_0023665805 /DNA_START=60 /DNA_END=1439 /DNA_ORIENTATION=+
MARRMLPLQRNVSRLPSLALLYAFACSTWCFLAIGHGPPKSTRTVLTGSSLPAQIPMEAKITRSAVGVAGLTSEDLNMLFQALVAISPVFLYRFILETGRQKTARSDNIFGYTAWEDTKRDGRYVDVVKSLTGLEVLERLQGQLMFLNLLAAGSIFYEEYVVPQGAPDLALPLVPFAVGFFALSLLLAFRTNESRSRFARARDLWDDILNISRSLYQQTSQTLDRDQFMELARWIPAFPAALRAHLRGASGRELRQELRASRGPDHEAHEVPEVGGVTEAEIAEVLNRPSGLSAPLFVLHRIAAITAQLNLAEPDRVAMESSLSKLSNMVGSCEALRVPPMPMSYATHTSSFQVLYLVLLPLALQQLGAGAVIAEQIVAYALLGVGGIADSLEEPFVALPIDKICAVTALESQALRDDWDRLQMGGGPSKGLPWYVFKPTANVLAKKVVTSEQVEMQYS